jgi:prenyltransferase/squalene oxidase-like repeat protein
VSWPLASFAIVFGVLATGWLAYERSRPSARMVAVVGTLAALAALGRDAFVALPDVKPITAMTLVVGYALGPLPGFTVGAVGMLASNVVLGQGPYTPWQMAAWGLVGLLGAALGRFAGGRLGRVSLALACALSALVAKEIMNVYEWTVSASHTWPSLALMIGKGLPFDVTDVVASFMFGLAFGPELARLLSRTRERMTVAWEPPALVAVVLALAVLAISSSLAQPRPASASPGAAAAGSASRIVAFLERAQDADGGFGAAFGERSSELYSAWAALGLSAAGRAPTRVQRSGHSVLDAIRGEASTLQGAGDLERTILALRACGAPASLPGLGDLGKRLEGYRDSDGSFEHLVNITAFAVLALRADRRAPGDPVVHDAIVWLEGQQAAGGGFGYAGRGSRADVDDTAAVVQALAAGRSSGAVAQDAVQFLLRSANLDGGFPQQPGGESNAQSTAWAVQALVAAHRAPARALPLASRSPLAYLQGLVGPDGSVRYSRASAQTPVWVSAQTLTALAGKPMPIEPPRELRAHGDVPYVVASQAHPSHVAGQARASASSGSAHDRGLAAGPRGGAARMSPAARSGAFEAMASGKDLDRLVRLTGLLIGLMLDSIDR